MLKIESISSEFTILNRKINGKRLVFLDSAASAQKPQYVIDAMMNVMHQHYANVNRGVYTLSEESTAMVEESRRKIAAFINAAEPDQIIFTRNTTESINLVMYAWARKHLHRGDVVALTEMEHHSNIVPWQILAKEIGVEIAWIPVDDNGYLIWEDYNARTFGGRLKLLSVTHVSNVLGTINPIREIVKWAHGLGAKVLVDGAQGITNLPVDVVDLDCDWYAFSGHKLYGPTGVGVLYGKSELINQTQPFLGGGDMIESVSKQGFTFKDPPHRFEAGTPAIVEIIGLGAAIDFVQQFGMGAIREHQIDLISYALEKLAIVSGLSIFGPLKNLDKGGVISFTLTGVHPHDIATILNSEGVAIRSGHHCAQVLCERLGQSALARISFGVYSTTEDIDQLIVGLQTVREVFHL